MRMRILLAATAVGVSACGASEFTPSPVSDACVLAGACSTGMHFDPLGCRCVVDSPDAEASPEASPSEGGGSITEASDDTSLPEAGGDTNAAQCVSIEEYCARDSSRCVTDWSAAQNPSTWCNPPSRSIFLYPNCQGYNFVLDPGTDTSFIYAYDANTLQLVGIEFEAASLLPHVRCVAGAPPDINLSTCRDALAPRSLCESLDAGCAPPNVLRYTAPGCGVDAHPTCGSPTQDACAIPVCSCTGHTIFRCDFSTEPFAYNGPCEDAGDASVDGQ